jgi:hypothetical protein
MPLTITDDQLKDFIMSWHEARMYAPDFEILNYKGEKAFIEAIGAEIEDIIDFYNDKGDEYIQSQFINYRTLQVLTDVAEMFGIQLPTDEQQKIYEDSVNKEGI